MTRVAGGRPAADPGSQSADLPPPEPAALPPEPKAPANPGRSKFTLLLSESDAIMWDELAMMLRRETGHRVEKAAFVRALVYLAAEDADLRRQVGEEIARDTTA
ncbi:hypothetical protein GCM10010522_71560 [Kribbella solani]